jgi:ABC-type uncharacterized transport system substrate-binding protein
VRPARQPCRQHSATRRQGDRIDLHFFGTGRQKASVAQGTRAIAGPCCGLVQSGGSQQGVGVQAKSARSLKLALHAYEARSLIEIDRAFARMADDHAQALVIFSDVLTVAHEKRLADLALENRLPAVFGFREFADMGGLISYGSSASEMWRRAASYVDKILRGTSPSDLPIEQPTRFELVINLKTAKALGLEIPPSLLATADEVIE